MAVIVIPIAIGAAQAGVWAYRAYQVYRAARLAAAAARAAQALEELEAAQSAAKPDDKAGEKTASQAMADAAASADCKDCNEKRECEEALEKLKKAVYDTKGNEKKGIVGNSGVRGLAERLCHYLFGDDPALNDSHQQAVRDGLKQVEKLVAVLSGKAAPEFTKDELARMNKKQKEKLPEKRLNNCVFPEDLQEDLDDLMKFAKEVAEGKASISPMPRKDFLIPCTANAAKVVLDVLRK